VTITDSWAQFASFNFPNALICALVSSARVSGGQAMVIGTSIVTSAVNAALANAMAAHADETDDTNPIGPVHLGCGAVPAALATAELTGRTGQDLLRAVTVAYEAKAIDLVPVPGARRANELIVAVGNLDRSEPVSRLRGLSARAIAGIRLELHS
jgi:2-methylcitrate dehydratase PrpD